MAQTLQGDRVNRFTISSTANHTDESFEGNMDVSSLSSVSVLSRKKNVRVYARNAISGAWSVLAIVGPTASTVEGTGTKHHRDTTLNTTDYDRISVVTVDGADADVRVVHSSILPSAILSRGQAASYTTEHELTSLATGVAQTINNITGMPIVQVFEQTTTAGAGSTELDVLRLHLDSNLTDSSTSGHTVTANGNAAITTSEKKFGAGSIALDGSGDSLSVPHSADFNFGAGDFTIETWIRFSSIANQGGGGYGIMSHGGWGMTSADYPGWMIGWGQGGSLGGTHLRLHGSGGSNVGAAFQPSLNTWYHLAITRVSGTVNIFIDGTLSGSGTVSLGDTSHTLYVGRAADGGGPLNGHIDDFRITKGEARYTANFTVPTAAHPDANSAGTSTLTDKTHNYTVTHDSSANQLSVTSDSPMATIKVRIATA